MVHVYADDGNVVDKASSLRDSELNQIDLDSIYDWLVINQLPLCQTIRVTVCILILKMIATLTC